MNVYSLSDEELLQQLREHGIEFGPILESTRRVYQKKLERVLSGEVQAEPFRDDTADTMPVDDIDFSDPDEEPQEPVVVQTRPRDREDQVRQRPSRDPAEQMHSSQGQYNSSQSSRPYSASQSSSQGEYTSSQSSRPYSASQSSSQRPMYSTPSSLSRPPLSSRNPADDIVTQAKPDQQPPKKKGLSIWIQLLILIVVALVIFLVFQNMEPAAKLPTRGIGAEV